MSGLEPNSWGTGAASHASVEHQLGPVAEAEAAPVPAEHGLPLPEFDTAPHTEAARAEAGTAAQAEAADDSAPLTDAWFGTYGTAISRALSSSDSVNTGDAKPKQNKTTRMVAETILASDDRAEIQNAGNPPYDWICSLTITAANGTRWLGTGWLAAPGLVITAGHCVYLHNSGGWAASVLIEPGRSGSDTPFSITSSVAYTVSGWLNDRSPACDYGAFVIPPDAVDVGWFGYAARPDAVLNGDTVNVVGYPADKPRGTMWGNVHALSPPTADELVYLNDTYGGMSGSPVIEWDGHDYAVLGIHNYGDLTGNRATRITANVFQNLQVWSTRARGAG